MRLIKLSEPGWTEYYPDTLKLQQRLYTRICSQCRAEENISEISNIDEMLATACGCEYMVE